MRSHGVNAESRAPSVTDSLIFSKKKQNFAVCTMLEDASNNELVRLWRSGNQGAAQVLFQRYMARLTALARSRLSRKLSRRLDAEDIVLSAWRSFFVATNLERLSVPADDNIWPLLVTLTLRKLSRQAARHSTHRRGIASEVSFEPADWEVAISRDPTPGEAAQLTDEVEALLAVVGPREREVLVRLLQGESQTAIASALNCSERTVRRAIQRIRSALNQQSDNPDLVANPDPPNSFAAETESACTPPSDALRPVRQATVFYSDFVLKELIGQGGFGKVYRAVRVGDQQRVAIKFLKKSFWKDETAVENLIEETHCLANLSHPNIIRHHGWGRTPHGAVFIAMDYIDGSNAYEWSATLPGLQDILQCGLQVANALIAAHSAGIIHGDVTPRNVLRNQDGQFILADFGFARQSALVHARGGGAPAFLAPEQVSDVFGSVTELTDIYGFGGLLYFLLTRRPPTVGDDVGEILANAISSRPPIAPSELTEPLPQELESIVLTCLNKEPSDRPKSISDVAVTLDRAFQQL